MLNKRPRNLSLIPSGMLAPSGLREDEQVNPAVQSTTRPAGTLLRPSPGFDSVRLPGKMPLRGKGPTGGFLPFEFAEDIGGSGTATGMIVPGDVSSVADTEWLPEDPEQIEGGSFVIADRGVQIGAPAMIKHEGERVLADLGDRSPGRPLSRSFWEKAGATLKGDYQQNPVVTVLVGAGIVALAYMIGSDAEGQYRRRRGNSVASAGVAVPAAGAATAGDETDKAANAVADAGDKAVKAIQDAADTAVGAVREAGETAKQAANDAANTVS